jgi:hypothetical protein
MSTIGGPCRDLEGFVVAKPLVICVNAMSAVPQQISKKVLKVGWCPTDHFISTEQARLSRCVSWDKPTIAGGTHQHGKPHRRN